MCFKLFLFCCLSPAGLRDCVRQKLWVCLLFKVGNGVEDPHSVLSRAQETERKKKEMLIHFCGDASKTVSACQTELQLVFHSEDGFEKERKKKTALLMYVADRQTSVRRRKKGKESIEEGSGHGADCLLTSPQGKIPCQTQTRLHVAEEHVAFYHPTIFLSWRVNNTIFNLRSYKQFRHIKHTLSIFQTLITSYMKEIISNPGLRVDPGITCPLFTHTHCKTQGYMYVSHAAFLSSPGSNIHWNKMFALENDEWLLRLLKPHFTMAPFNHMFSHFQRKSLLQTWLANKCAGFCQS